MTGKARTRKSKYKKLRIDRLLSAVVIICLVTFSIDAVVRNVKGETEKNIDDKHFNTLSNTDVSEPSNEENNAIPLVDDNKTINIFQDGICYETILTESKIYEGRLALVGDYFEEHSGGSEKCVDLSQVKNDFYTLIAENMMLDGDAAEALNKLMEDYNNATGLSDFVVYGTTKKYTGDDTCYSEFFEESKLGYSVDLALSGYGEIIAYDGKDEESWVIENCWKYGFIVRYPQGKNDETGHGYSPWHLRYVGKANAGVMHKNNVCLEEYVELIKGYKFENPLKYTYGSVDYMIFSVESTGENTLTYVTNSTYSISGNGKDGFITTIPKD